MRHSKKKRGNATVEFLLLVPIFISIIGYSNILGSMARARTYSATIGDDMLRYNDGSSYSGLTSQRPDGQYIVPSDVEARKMWQINNPDDSISITSNLGSQGTSYTYSATPSSSASLNYNDPINITNTINFMQREVWTLDAATGELTMRVIKDRELIYLEQVLQESEVSNEDAGVILMIDERSLNRYADLELEVKPWLTAANDDNNGGNRDLYTGYNETTTNRDHDLVSSGGDLFPMIIEKTTYRHMRNPSFDLTPWSVDYSTSNPGATFHSYLNDFFLNSGIDDQVGANLKSPEDGAWSTYSDLRLNEGLSGN